MSSRDEKKTLIAGNLEGQLTYLHILKVLAGTMEDAKTKSAIVDTVDSIEQSVLDTQGLFEDLVEPDDLVDCTDEISLALERCKFALNGMMLITQSDNTRTQRGNDFASIRMLVKAAQDDVGKADNLVCDLAERSWPVDKSNNGDN